MRTTCAGSTRASAADSSRSAAPTRARLSERGAQIVQQIPGRLDPDRQPQQSVGDPPATAVRRGHRGVGHRRRVGDQRLDAAEALGGRAQPQATDEATRPGPAAEIERDDTAERRHLLAGQVVLWVGLQAGVVHGDDLTTAREPAGDLLRVVAVPLHAQRQRLDSAQDQVGVEGRDDRPGALLDLPQLRPPGLVGGDHRAADAVAVTVEVLGRRVQHQIGTPLEGSLEAGCREGVVDDGQQSPSPGDPGRGAQVGQGQDRIRRRLQEQHPGAIVDRRADRRRVGGVDPGDLQSAGACQPLEQPVGPAVDVLGGDQPVAGAQQAEHGVDRRHARGEGTRRRSAFEIVQVAFEGRPCRVDHPAVAPGRATVQIPLAIGRRQTDRRRDRAGRRVRLLAGVDDPGLQSPLARRLRAATRH